MNTNRKHLIPEVREIFEPSTTMDMELAEATGEER